MNFFLVKKHARGISKRDAISARFNRARNNVSAVAVFRTRHVGLKRSLLRMTERNRELSPSRQYVVNKTLTLQNLTRG